MKSASQVQFAYLLVNHRIWDRRTNRMPLEQERAVRRYMLRMNIRFQRLRRRLSDTVMEDE